MFLRFVILLVAAALLVGGYARTSSGAGAERVYVVRPADTLWSIATRHYGGDPREAVWRIQRRNGLSDPTLIPGTVLALPP